MKNLLKAKALMILCFIFALTGCASNSANISDADNTVREVIKAQPTPLPEAQREIGQKKKLKTLEGKGGGGGGSEPDLEISDFAIRTGRFGVRWLWGSSATYTYNGSGLDENITFRVQARNLGPGDFNGTIAITVYSTTSPGPSPVGITTPYITISEGSLSDYFYVVLNQSEQIERGRLSPGATYRLMAKIKYYDGADWENMTSGNRVTLTLARPHPAGRGIPKRTFHLTSEVSLTGSVEHDGTVEDNLEASSLGPTRGFISFNLSQAQEELQEWRRNGWGEFEVTTGTLEIEQTGISVDLTDDPIIGLDTTGNWMACDRTSPEDLRRGHEALGDILLDLLDYGDSLTSSDYNGPIMTNLYTFRSACTRHSFYADAYVRYQLASGLSRIQYRLRLPNEGKRVRDDPVTAWFKTPCTLTFTIEAKE